MRGVPSHQTLKQAALQPKVIRRSRLLLSVAAPAPRALLGSTSHRWRGIDRQKEALQPLKGLGLWVAQITTPHTYFFGKNESHGLIWAPLHSSNSIWCHQQHKISMVISCISTIAYLLSMLL